MKSTSNLKQCVAADKGDWKSYVQLMGGVFCKRKDLLNRPYYDVEADKQTGLIKTSWFDDVIVLQLKGVLYAGQTIITHLHQWQLETGRRPLFAFIYK